MKGGAAEGYGGGGFRGDQAGGVHGFGQGAGREAAGEAEIQGFVRVEGARREEQVEGAVAADDAVQVSKVDGGGQGEVDLGIAEACVLACNDHVARDGECHAAAACCAIDGGDGRFAHVSLDVPELDIEAVEKGADGGIIAAEDDVEVEAGAEHLLDAAGEHHHAHIGIGGGVAEGLEDLVEKADGEGVQRRARQGDDRDVVGGGVTDKGGHGDSPPAMLCGCAATSMAHGVCIFRLMEAPPATNAMRVSYRQRPKR